MEESHHMAQMIDTVTFIEQRVIQNITGDIQDTQLTTGSRNVAPKSQKSKFKRDSFVTTVTTSETPATAESRHC